VWTIERVKAELPDVSVEWRGRVYRAAVRGRLCAVATVWLLDLPEVSSAWSWSAVVRSLESGRPLVLV